MDAALSAAWRGGRLTQQLLAFARQQRLKSTSIDVNALIAGMEGLLGHTLGGLVRVETTLAPDLWAASTDTTQFEMVLLNLAINARDAMQDGGVLRIITANTGVAETLPAALDAGDYVVVTVADTGTGMTKEVRERAFEPFFTTKDVGKGSGLGLAQAYGVARRVRRHRPPGQPAGRRNHRGAVPAALGFAGQIQGAGDSRRQAARQPGRQGAGGGR